MRLSLVRNRIDNGGEEAINFYPIEDKERLDRDLMTCRERHSTDIP